MKPKTLMLLAIAGMCGLVATFAVQQAMLGSQRSAKVETTRVLVALENINPGLRLTEDNVAFREMPLKALPQDPVTSVEQFEERAALVPLLAGDIVRVSKLTEKGGYGRSMEIPKGMRVMTISVNDTHTASGLLQPGDRVDVLVTYESRRDRGRSVTRTQTLLEYVEVFATDDHTASKAVDDDESKRAKNVSLLLTPEQVPYIKLAESKGKLSLSWRHRLDDSVVNSRSINEELLEELQGTLGNQASRPKYAENEDAALERGDAPAPTAAEFLDNLVQETPPAVEPQPAKEQWEVKVFTGSDPTVQVFDVEPPKVEPPPAAHPPMTTGAAELINRGLQAWFAGTPSEEQVEAASTQTTDAETAAAGL